MRLLRAVDHRRMAWKNGGGETTEIALAPHAAGLDAFDWRISMARVEADGPFSLFPGVERTLAVIEGGGIELSVEGRAPHLLTPASAPLAFPADAPTQARLTAGPIVDLNVMVRRGRFSATLERLDGPLALPAAAHPTLILALRPIDADASGGPVALQRDDALLLEGEAVRIATKAPFYRIALVPIGRG